MADNTDRETSILSSVHFLDPFVPWTWLRALPYLVLASSLAAADGYFVHNLDSDLPGAADQQQDTLIDPWDFIALNTCTPVGSPYCTPHNVSSVLITSNGSGTVTQYTPIPGVVQPDLYPNLLTGVTGIIGGYGLPQPGTNGLASGLLVCTDGGTIAGLAEYLPTFVTILVDNSKSGAVYKGCTSAYSVSDVSRPFYYAANFGNGKIDVWDSNLNPVENPAAFVDPAVPAGFAPFNIQAISDKVLLVTYAQQDTSKRNDVPGAGKGYIATFDLNGNLLQTLVARGPLNSPWGLMIAPATFGNFARALLVGNSDDGRINAFDPTTGAWKGALADSQSNPIAIPGLDAIKLGGGGATGDSSTLYFTAGIAGPNGEPPQSHGLFGSIQAAPYFQTSGILNGGDFSSAIAPNAWVTIQGGSLSAKTRSWTLADFTSQGLPTKLDNVSVTVNGRPTYVSYISPTQVNFLLPVDLTPGPVEIVATNNGLSSEPVSALISNAAPAFLFLFPGEQADGLYFVPGVVKNYIAALHANNSVATTVLPGETVELFGNGFGATMTAAPDGQLLTVPLPLIDPVQVTIGEQPAQVTFVGLVAPGLYQVNVLVPSLDSKYRNFGVPVIMSVSGAASQASGYLAYDWPAIN